MAVATNELARLPQMPEVTKVAAMLKAVYCQVNEIRQDQRPSYSMSLIRRSTMLRLIRRPSRSHFVDQHHDDRHPLQGELGTRKSTRMSEHTLTISETRDDVSTSTVFLTMKKKYATIKSTSKSLVIRSQPSSHSTLVTSMEMIPKGPKHS